MEFTSQVPVQIRRSGRNNSEGIDYSMSQWYPKVVEYDRDGWHATPYIAREYYGVWGDFDVRIVMDSSYTIAATGVLQNASAIGKGYADRTVEPTTNQLMWHFSAERVHDFVWAADRDYLHTKRKMSGGPELHFFFQNDTAILDNWTLLPDYTEKCFAIMKDLVGAYPYPVYSVIQGGDGGMEYPMATLVMGTGKKNGLIGVTVHEAIHSWFQGLLGNNEGDYPWMDEGFDTYYDEQVMDSLTVLAALAALAAGTWAFAQPADGPMMGPGRDGERPWGFRMPWGDRGEMMGTGMMGPGMMRMMLIVMDTDGDGALSLEEVQAVHARVFAAMDANDDGRVTPEEMEGFMHGETE
jgi:hypothetical protein